MKPVKPTVLALDLEGTLISNAISQFPRPGLWAFLAQCRALFPRVVLFTFVSEEKARAIARGLVQEQAAPAWFAEVEYVHWAGQTKDLRYVPGVSAEAVVLVDDMAAVVHPGQEGQWLEIAPFDPPYPDADRELSRVLERLLDRIGQ